MFLNIWNSLSWPLQVVLKFKPTVIEFFVDIEPLLEIIQEEPSIIDEEDAPGFELKEGTICFNNVSFKYDGKVNQLLTVSLLHSRAEAKSKHN